MADEALGIGIGIPGLRGSLDNASVRALLCVMSRAAGIPTLRECEWIP